MKRTATAAALSIALANGMPISTAAAQTGLSDLIGARAGQAEMEVQRRGYRPVRTQEGGAAKWVYWRRGDECVQITTRDGRYLRIDPAALRECQAGGSGSSSAAAVVAGVAIVGLAAALAAHRNDHRDADREHDDDYSRGYQAALYGASYDDRHDSEGYHEGFMAGEAEAANRRHANSRWVQDAPEPARAACARAADEFQNQPYGSSVPVSVRALGRGDYQLTMATGTYRSRCNVSATGVVRNMEPG